MEGSGFPKVCVHATVLMKHTGSFNLVSSPQQTSTLECQKTLSHFTQFNMCIKDSSWQNIYIKMIASGCEHKTHHTILSSLFTQYEQCCIMLHRVLFQVLSSILQSSGTLTPSMSGLERSATAHSGRARSLFQVQRV